MVIQREGGPCRNVQQAAGGSGKGIPYGQGPIRPQAENAALNVQTAQPARINGLLPASLLDQIDDSGAVRLHKLGILVALILLRPHVVAAVRARGADHSLEFMVLRTVNGQGSGSPIAHRHARGGTGRGPFQAGDGQITLQLQDHHGGGPCTVRQPASQPGGVLAALADHGQVHDRGVHIPRRLKLDGRIIPLGGEAGTRRRRLDHAAETAHVRARQVKNAYPAAAGVLKHQRPRTGNGTL